MKDADNRLLSTGAVLFLDLEVDYMAAFNARQLLMLYILYTFLHACYRAMKCLKIYSREDLTR